MLIKIDHQSTSPVLSNLFHNTLIDTNVTVDTNHSIMWETFKAYMRGQHVSHDKQLRSFTLSNIMDPIQHIEKLFTHTYYELGDKPSRLLAHQLCEATDSDLRNKC